MVYVGIFLYKMLYRFVVGRVFHKGCLKCGGIAEIVTFGALLRLFGLVLSMDGMLVIHIFALGRY